MDLQHGLEQLHQLPMLLEMQGPLVMPVMQAMLEMAEQEELREAQEELVLEGEVELPEPLEGLRVLHRVLEAAQVEQEELVDLELQLLKVFRLFQWVPQVVLVV
jgi:hypothetical protein